MIRGSVSQQLRNGFIETSGKNSIYHKAGSQLVEKILGEFEVLVRETPQWTGTTAASWYIGMTRDESTLDQVNTQPERTSKEALKKGSEPACAFSINKSKSTLMDADLVRIATEDIVVGNSAPGFDRAEEGPVRPENSPPGALDRFMARVSLIDFEVDFYK